MVQINPSFMASTESLSNLIKTAIQNRQQVLFFLRSSLFKNQLHSKNSINYCAPKKEKKSKVIP